MDIKYILLCSFRFQSADLSSSTVVTINGRSSSVSPVVYSCILHCIHYSKNSECCTLSCGQQKIFYNFSFQFIILTATVIWVFVSLPAVNCCKRDIVHLLTNSENYSVVMIHFTPFNTLGQASKFGSICLLFKLNSLFLSWASCAWTLHAATELPCAASRSECVWASRI